jgi:tRNA(Ile)-lysidine synthetase-like protein
MTASLLSRRHPFILAVARSLAGACAVEGGERLVVAVSGGADSVALLIALHALSRSQRWEFDLAVAHIHHHLRDEAEDEARQVEALSQRLGLPFHRRDVHPADEGGNLESVARRLRYKALAEIASKIDADAIATAHHADDQLETILMRLIRGASLRGLAGIAPRQRLAGFTIIRPMLEVTREQAIDLLQACGETWVEDHTNRDIARWRARLRADVLPVLKSLRGDASTKASQAASQLQAASRWVDRYVEGLRRRLGLTETQTQASLPRDKAQGLSPFVLGELLRQQSQALGLGADQLPTRLTDQIIAAIRDQGGEARQFKLAGGMVVEVTADHVTWDTAPSKPPGPTN